MSVMRIQSLMKRIVNQKLLFKVLSLLLCVVLIFTYCGIGQAITAHAVFGVDDALLYVVLTVLASMGISMSSSMIADTIVNKIANTDFSDVWQRKKAELQVLIDSGISIGQSIKMNFNDDDWKQVKSSISNYLNDNNYITSSMNNIDTGSYSSLYDYLVAGNTLSIRIDNFDSYYNQFFKLSDNCTLRLCGSTVASTYTFSDRTPDYFNNKLTAIYNVTGTGLRYLSMCCTIPNDSTVINISLNTSGSSPYSLSNKCDVVKSYLNYQAFQSYAHFYFHTNKCSGNYTNGLYLSCNESDVVDNGNIDSLSLPATVLSSDNTLNRANWFQWLLGGDVGATTLPLNVDTKAYNDTWTNSDSVSINVPTTLDDALSQTTSQARGQATSSSGSTGTNTADFPSIKKLSLPNLLFSKFPFCLPTDLYNLFAVFVAEPEAPKFEIPFSYESLNIDCTFTIDFSEYEYPISILRFFCGAEFCLGLILLTRKLIGAGG